MSSAPCAERSRPWVLAATILGAISVGVFAGAVDERLDRLQAAPEVRSALQAEVPKLVAATLAALSAAVAWLTIDRK